MTRKRKIEVIKSQVEEMSLEYTLENGVFRFPTNKITHAQANMLYQLALELGCSWEHEPASYRQAGCQEWRPYGPTVAYLIQVP